MIHTVIHEPALFPGQLHEYVCHIACMYWALRVHYHTEHPIQVARRTDKRAAMLCPLCNPPPMQQQPPQQGFVAFQQQNNGAHDVRSDRYGALFHNKAERYDASSVQLGDVILFDGAISPQHSAVCCAIEGGTVFVRGFNNRGQFALCTPMPVLGKYDPHLRSMSERALKTPLFLVRAMTYVETIVNMRPPAFLPARRNNN